MPLYVCNWCPARIWISMRKFCGRRIWFSGNSISLLSQFYISVLESWENSSFAFGGIWIGSQTNQHTMSICVQTNQFKPIPRKQNLPDCTQPINKTNDCEAHHIPFPMLPIVYIPSAEHTHTGSKPGEIEGVWWWSSGPSSRGGKSKDTYVHIANGNTTHIGDLSEGRRGRWGWELAEVVGRIEVEESKISRLSRLAARSLCAVGSLSLFGLAVP